VKSNLATSAMLKSPILRWIRAFAPALAVLLVPALAFGSLAVPLNPSQLEPGKKGYAVTGTTPRT